MASDEQLRKQAAFAMQQRLQKLCTDEGILHTCLNCTYWPHDLQGKPLQMLALCKLHNAEPPLYVVTAGCESWIWELDSKAPF